MKKLIDLLLKLVFTFTLIWFFNGVLKFPDALISQCSENNYCGKYGNHHSVEDFEDYRRWNIINFIAFPVIFLLLMLNKQIDNKDINDK